MRLPVMSLILLLTAAAATKSPHQAILGEWKGTSICEKVPGNESCHDEIVTYKIRQSSTSADLVTVDAYKTVNGETGLMGTMDFRRAGDAVWNCELTTRIGQVEWSLSVDGRVMKGTLQSLADHRLLRKASLTKE